MHDPLAALAALERRFDGPIPEPLRLMALHGSARAVLLRRARRQEAFFAALIPSQKRAIALRRQDGSFYPALLADLALYRRQKRRWAAIARRLAMPAKTKRTTRHRP
jgi:hypothetical protein